MKYVIYALVIVASLSAGGAAIGYYGMEEFNRVTNLDWTSFDEQHAKCEAMFKEPCGIYGGFAPKSQIGVAP